MELTCTEATDGVVHCTVGGCEIGELGLPPGLPVPPPVVPPVVPPVLPPVLPPGFGLEVERR